MVSGYRPEIPVVTSEEQTFESGLSKLHILINKIFISIITYSLLGDY